MQTKYLCVLIHIWTKGEVGALLKWFKSSSKIFLLTVQRRCLFSLIIYVIAVLFCYAFMRICLLMPCGHLLGKGLPIGSRLWYLIVKLSLSNWYPGSGVVLDCIHSWSCLLSYFAPNSLWGKSLWKEQRNWPILHIELYAILLGIMEYPTSFPSHLRSSQIAGHYNILKIWH